MTLDTLSKYTEESISQCKELLNFIKKKSQLDLDYSKAIGKDSCLIGFAHHQLHGRQIVSDNGGSDK